MSYLKNYPIPISGLALGTAGLAAFWSNFATTEVATNSILVTAALIVITLLSPLCLKFLVHRNILFENLKHPTIGSVIPTLAMSLMLLSQTLLLFHKLFAEKLWIFAVILHISFLITFGFHQLRAFDLNHIVPSWFIPPIGIVVACLTVPSERYIPLANSILIFGLVAYSIMLPLMIYRLFRGERIENARKPTLAVLAAPASLTLSGYLSLYESPNTTFVILLFMLALFMTASVYLMLFRLIRLSFTPGFSAFTFPLVISATAMYKISLWTTKAQALTGWTNTFYYGSIIEGVIASIMTIYVLSHYCRYLLTSKE